MRTPIVVALLCFASAAAACPAGDDVTLTREEDGAIFNPDRYGQTAAGPVFRGLFDGRTAYLQPSTTPGSAAAGTSGYQPPAPGIRWQQSLGSLEDGQPLGTVDEGPLQGTWSVTCQATN